jgi:hypothetical protein
MLFGLVSVNVPPLHTLVVDVTTVRPVFSRSLNPTPARATVLADGLVIVNVNVLVVFTLIGDVTNEAEIEGGAATVSVAVLLGPPFPPSVEVTLIRLVLLLPAVVPVTLTETVHDEPAAGDAANVPPERPMLLPRAVAVGVALPQVPMMLGLEATVTPVGRP